VAQRAPVLGIHNPFPYYQTRHVQHESDRDVCNRGLQEARTHVEHGTSNSEEVHDPVVIPIFLPGLVCSSPIEMNSLDGQGGHMVLPGFIYFRLLIKASKHQVKAHATSSHHGARSLS
jgi:hypothetical protein